MSKKMCPEIFDTLHIRTHVDMQILPHARMNFEVLTFKTFIIKPPTQRAIHKASSQIITELKMLKTFTQPRSRRNKAFTGSSQEFF